jgi:hypothetical protein
VRNFLKIKNLIKKKKKFRNRIKMNFILENKKEVKVNENIFKHVLLK